MTRPASVHWLRENAREATPHRVLVLDTETDIAGADDPGRQVLRLWSARLTLRHDTDPKRPRESWLRGTTADELADAVDGEARSSGTLWVFAHNLAFDLSTSELPVRLIARGWRITDAALTTDAPWCRMARGSRRIAIADTWSYLPTSVARLGELVGLPKLDLPDATADPATWQARCDRDVEITAKAIISVMDWWDRERIGNWTITGPSAGWGSYRHRRPAPRVLIDPDPIARAFEARAVTGGRREVRRVGEQPRGLYADLDMATAHLTAMAGLALPHKRLRAFASLPIDSPLVRSQAVGILAECTVATTTPRYPWDSGHGVFYPVGTFRTVLAGPEVHDAASRGELSAIGRGYLYLTSPHMSDWALWVASLLDDRTPDVPPVVRLMAKAWSRSVPGKWAGRTSEVIERVPDPRPGWMVEEARLMPGRTRADLLTIGGERWTIARDLWSDDAFPAILAWVQSATRVALGRLVDMLGPAMLSCNTDGLIVDVSKVLDTHASDSAGIDAGMSGQLDELGALCTAWDDVLAPFGVRVKDAARRLRVLSPSHVILGDRRKLAGIPKGATPIGVSGWSFTAWPGLRVQLAPDHRPGYRTRERTVEIGHIPPAGWLDVDGRVWPVTTRTDGDGTIVLPWVESPEHEWPRLAPRDRQHPALRALMPTIALDPPGIDGERQTVGSWA